MKLLKKQQSFVLSLLFGILIGFFSLISQAEILGLAHSEEFKSASSKMTMSPDGNYLYVLDQAKRSIAIKKIDPHTGLFIEATDFKVDSFLEFYNVSLASSPLGYPAISPDGKYFYLLSFPLLGGVDILQFRIDQKEGALSFIEKKSLYQASEYADLSRIDISHFYFSKNNQFSYIRIIFSDAKTTSNVDVFYTLGINAHGQLSVLNKSQKSSGHYYHADFVILENNQFLYQQGDGHFVVYRMDSHGIPVEVLKQNDERLSGSFKMIADYSSQFLYVYVPGKTGGDLGEIFIYKIGKDGHLTYQSRFVPIYAPYGDKSILYGLNNFSLSRNNKILFLNEGVEGYVIKLKRNEETGELNFLGFVNNDTFYYGEADNFREFLASPDDRFIYVSTPDVDNSYTRFAVLSAYSDLVLTQSALPAEISKGKLTVLEVTVNHVSGADAENVTLTQELSSGLSVIAVTASSGRCVVNPSNSKETTCHLGTVPLGGQIKVTMGLKASSAGDQVVNTVVSHDHVELDESNHRLKAHLRIVDDAPVNTERSGGGSFGLFFIAFMALFAKRLRWCRSLY